jgi:hypothetical protein
MHGEQKIKLIDAKQAKPFYHYQNTKENWAPEDSHLWPKRM